MKLMFSRSFSVVVAITVVYFVVFCSASVSAQSKKTVAVKKSNAKTQKADAKKTVAKRNEKPGKDAKKDQAKGKTVAKKDQRASSKNDKAAAKVKKDPRKSAEARRELAERRRKEAERRQAAIAEQRRREQARREAIARKVAFERGLRTETVQNILNDKTEGEDLRVRKAAIDALGSRAGSVVVMEAQTGKILTIVNQEWAVRRTIRPCSTIKLVTAAAGLNEGVISKETGAVKNISTRRDLDDALAHSDNPYFQRVGSNLGNTKLVEYGKRFGLGEQTGVNLEGEAPGRLPYSNNNARIYSHGDDTEVSTIQLAVMASAMTNGGHRVLPRVPRSQADQKKFQTFYKANVELPQQNVRRIIPGMMGAAEYGTARRNMDQSLGVAGKTGSCIDKGSWVGLFTSVAPIEQPKYAIAVITRGQSERGRYAAAVAAQVYNFLSGNIVRTDRNLAQTEFNLRPKNVFTTTATTAANTADEDEDDVDTTETGSADGRNVIVVPNATRPVTAAPKKLVTKTSVSKPVFPPVIITYDREGKPVNGSPKDRQ